MRDTDHLCVTLAFTFSIEQVPEGEEVAHDRKLNLDAGKTPCWAGATHYKTGRSSPTSRTRD